jgi:hypothetical protein
MEITLQMETPVKAIKTPGRKTKAQPTPKPTTKPQVQQPSTSTADPPKAAIQGFDIQSITDWANKLLYAINTVDTNEERMNIIMSMAMPIFLVQSILNNNGK